MVSVNRALFHFNRSVESFSMGDIPCIANFENGSIIGLDNNGTQLVKQIARSGYSAEMISPDQVDMAKAMFESGFFEATATCTDNTNVLKSSYIHVTNRCNLNCAGCYSYDCTRNTKEDLSLEDLKNIMDQLRESGVDNITISGGEPLVRKDIVQIIHYAREKCGFSNISLITNGTVFNPRTVEGLRQYISEIAVSVDGYDCEHPTFLRDPGIFDVLMENIPKFQQSGFKVVILPTLHRKNAMNIANYMQLAKNLEASISFSLMTCSADMQEYIPTNEQLKELSNYFDGSSDNLGVKIDSIDDYNIVARKSCGAGREIISIGAFGEVYPCHMMHQINAVMGNIKDTPLRTILDNHKQLPEVDDIKQCSECKYKYVCGGGCKARAVLLKNDYHDSDPYCEMFTTFFDNFTAKLKSE